MKNFTKMFTAGLALTILVLAFAGAWDDDALDLMIRLGFVLMVLGFVAGLLAGSGVAGGMMGTGLAMVLIAPLIANNRGAVQVMTILVIVGGVLWWVANRKRPQT